jgi:hypothetical protein
MSLFVLHLHKVVSYPALCRGNHYLQVRHHQAYVVGSCVERPTQEVDVHTVKGQALADLIAGRINTNITTLRVGVGYVF